MEKNQCEEIRRVTYIRKKLFREGRQMYVFFDCCLWTSRIPAAAKWVYEL